MPSVRFSRDKRGYEYVYLVHTTTRRGKPGRTRVLYWYRTPPGVRIGRKPFDEELQRSLEQQYPGVTFDWDTIINTPMPPPDMTEFWRERRRADKAAKEERRASEAEEAAVVSGASAAAAAADAADADASMALPDVAGPAIAEDAFTSADTTESTDVDAVAAANNPADVDTEGRKRRRRRGGVGGAGSCPKVRSLRPSPARRLPTLRTTAKTMKWMTSRGHQIRRLKKSSPPRQAWHNPSAMTLKFNGFWSSALVALLAAGLSAQTPARPPANPGQTPTFRVQIDAVTMDVVVKDDQGRFVPDLRKDEFEIYEDGIKQDISSMTLSHGGRVSNLLEAPPPPPPEGIILPPVRKVQDTSGRIFLFFVDDLHLQFQNTGRVRELFKKIGKNLIHEGDLFGIVSSGPSSISIDMTYDRRRLDEAINKMTGGGLKPSEIINTGTGSEGPTELRYQAHVAFSTMQEALENLEKVHNRRKALVWVSEGYDFNPFQDSRLGLRDPSSPFLQNQSNAMANNPDNGDGSSSSQPDSMVRQQQQSETFSDAELAFELGELTRAANRANTTIYTIDPRGLVAGADIDEQVDPMEWGNYVRKSQDSLRVLAEETGGVAVVNMNDFDKALKNIDAASSDYYVLGYYSNNPDVNKRRRQLEVKVTRKDLNVFSRKEYVLRAPKPPAPTAVPKQ